MDEELIKNYLAILEISSFDELRKLGIDNFWQKKFKKIHSDKIRSKKKETLLIEINNARDNLNDIDLEDLKRFINNANRKKATNNNDANKRTTSNENDANKIKTNKREANDSSKKTYQRTEKSPMGIKHPKALIAFFFIVIAGLISIPFIQERNPYKTANRSQSYEKNNSNSNKKVFKTIDYSNGRYVGDTIDDLPNGFGTFYWKDGDRYEGLWRNQKKSGYGTYYFKNGNKLTGNFIDDDATGKFKVTFFNGERYDGYLRSYKKHGFGIEYFNNGDRYEGYFLNDKRNGSGTYFYNDGTKADQYY